MLHSIQAGLQQAPVNCNAVLIVLGDQPQIESEVVENILTTFREKPEYRLIVPSYANRRGHPWLVARALWDEILSMQSPMTMRDFLKNHQQEIHYLSVDNASVLSDIDTPTDYQKALTIDENK